MFMNETFPWKFGEVDLMGYLIIFKDYVNRHLRYQFKVIRLYEAELDQNQFMKSKSKRRGLG